MPRHDLIVRDATDVRPEGNSVLEPGFDADFALVDLKAIHTPSETSLLTRHKLSPYLGRSFRGVVRSCSTKHPSRAETICYGYSLVLQSLCYSPCATVLVLQSLCYSLGQR
jgi:hypothetical protein